MNKKRDVIGAKIGMWLFLYTEIMLFGGLFVLYAAYLTEYSSDFIAAGKDLDLVFGLLNTVILLISSFMVAAAITAVRRNTSKVAVAFLISAIAMGIFFLINKYFEWGHKFEIGIYPNSPELLDSPPGRNIFFGLYYVITGLHGLHIVIGLVLLIVALCFVLWKRVAADNYGVLENAGLYWHLVDLIWIFIFPLFYLII
jgi:cytochrome c oxidase subunit 3